MNTLRLIRELLSALCYRHAPDLDALAYEAKRIAELRARLNFDY